MIYKDGLIQHNTKESEWFQKCSTTYYVDNKHKPWSSIRQRSLADADRNSNLLLHVNSCSFVECRVWPLKEPLLDPNIRYLSHNHGLFRRSCLKALEWVLKLDSEAVQDHRLLPGLRPLHRSHPVCLLLHGWHLSLQCIPLGLHLLRRILHLGRLSPPSG